MKIIPGTEGQSPIWLKPDPIYGPKDQSQDPRGMEMELKYTGHNLSRTDRFAFEKFKKAVAEAAAKRDGGETTKQEAPKS